MKITAIESFCNEFVGFVRVTVEDGSQGWGQLSTYHSDISAQVLHRQVAPWALGHDEADLDNLLDLITEREHKFPGSYLRRAMGGKPRRQFSFSLMERSFQVSGLAPQRQM